MASIPPKQLSDPCIPRLSVRCTVPKRRRALLPAALQEERGALECAEEPGEAALWYPVTRNFWMHRCPITPGVIVEAEKRHPRTQPRGPMPVEMPK